MLRKAERLTGLKWKGARIVFLKPDSNIGSVSELEKEMRENGETSATIAWTAYHKENKTAYVKPVIANPPRWAIEHEMAHVVLLSNGIGGHPARYNDTFKYWDN